MARVELSDHLIDYDEKARVEAGPKLVTAKATDTLLADNKTAAHYRVGALDALGVVIELGKNMTYLDWLGTPVWYVYHYENMPDDLAIERELPVGTKYWAEKKVFDVFADAEAFAQTLI